MEGAEERRERNRIRKLRFVSNFNSSSFICLILLIRQDDILYNIFVDRLK